MAASRVPLENGALTESKINSFKPHLELLESILKGGSDEITGKLD